MSKNINKLQLILRKYNEQNIDETVVGFTLAIANRNIGRKNFDESPIVCQFGQYFLCQKNCTM